MPDASLSREPVRAAVSVTRSVGLELGDLVERQLDGGLALEERDEHGELAALGLDLADRAGQARERAFLDGDGLADLEVDLGRQGTALRGRGLRAATLRRSDLLGLD